MPDPETLCLRCGRCCYQKEQVEGTWYIGPIPCKYLDIKTKLCLVYAARSSVPWCKNPLDYIQSDPCLPDDCPLALAFGPEGYVGAKEKL